MKSTIERFCRLDLGPALVDVACESCGGFHEAGIACAYTLLIAEIEALLGS